MRRRLIFLRRSRGLAGAFPRSAGTRCEDRQIGDQIEGIFKHHRRRDGCRRIAEELSDAGDRGSHYGSRIYRDLLRQAGIVQSMSARANPYHNAWTESSMGTLKTEMLQEGCFTGHTDARVELFAFIDSYYNTQRKHSSLGYQTPATFEAQLNSSNQPTLGPEIRCRSAPWMRQEN